MASQGPGPGPLRPTYDKEPANGRRYRYHPTRGGAVPVARGTRLDSDGGRGRPGRDRRRPRGQGRRLHRQDVDRRERRLRVHQRRLRPDRDRRSRLRADEAARLLPAEDDHRGDGKAHREDRPAHPGLPVPGLPGQRRLRGRRDGHQDRPRLSPPHGRQGPIQDRQPQGLVPRRHRRDALAGRRQRQPRGIRAGAPRTDIRSAAVRRTGASSGPRASRSAP